MNVKPLYDRIRTVVDVVLYGFVQLYYHIYITYIYIVLTDAAWRVEKGRIQRAKQAILSSVIDVSMTGTIDARSTMAGTH